MPTISSTTLDALEKLMVTTIEGITPRVEYQGGSAWKHYTRATSAASRSRRFTLRWVPGGVVPGGYMTTLSGSFAATLIIVTDYAGQHENIPPMVHDDWHQVRDRLASLTADTTTGLEQIQVTSSPPSRVGDTTESRDRLSKGGAANTDTLQVNLTYDVEFHQARAA